MQKKILNPRPIALFGVVMLASLYLVIYLNYFNLRISLLVLAAAIAGIGLILLIFVKSKKFRYVVSRISIFGLAIVCAIGCVTLAEIAYGRDNVDYSGKALISGRVADASDLDDRDYLRVVLDDVTISTDQFSKKLKYKASIVILCDKASDDTFMVGKRLDMFGKISFAKLYYKSNNKLTFYYYCHGISCSGYALEENVSVADSNLKLTLSERIKLRAEELISRGVDSEYVGLAQGMLFGEKSGLDPQISQSFSAAGVSHLLAVSGLHVGFLLSLLLLVAKLVRLKGICKFFVLSGIIIFYAYLCGFTVSVTRASVMCICSLYASCRYKRYDSLNALAVALIIVMVINPFSITTLGFKLSFGCVLGIILLAPGLSRVFGKILKPALAKTLAVMVSVQIAIIALQISEFKNITFVALVSNFITIPIASLAYMLLFVTLAISFVMPFMAFSIYLYQFVMQAAVKFVMIVSKVKALPLAPWKGTAILSLQLPAMYLSSNYIFGGGWWRKGVTAALWLAIVVLLFV